jgi:hypothetical protein
MLPLRLWLRRCSAAYASPVMVLICVWVIHARSGWQYEWDWALSNASTPSLLLAPLLTGLVAHDRARRVGPTVAPLSAAAPRGEAGLLSLAAASWLWTAAAWAVGLAYAAARVLPNGPEGWPNPWVLVEVPVLLALAAVAGLLVGTVLPNRAAGPVAALGLFALTLLARATPANGLFMAGGSTGTLAGLERTPAVAVAVVVAHLTLAAAALLATRAHTRPLGRRPWVRSVAAAGFAVVAITGVFAVNRSHEPYRPVTTAQKCVNGPVTVCGPSNTRPLLARAARDLGTAVTTLEGAELPWQRQYVLARGEKVREIPPDQSVLGLSPEEFTNGRLSTHQVASTLSRPRMCDAYFGGPNLDAAMENQGRVYDWITAQLRSSTPAGAAPQDVQDAFRWVATCEPARKVQ